MKAKSPQPPKCIPKPWGGGEPQDMLGLEGVLRLLSACHPKALFSLDSLGCMCSTVPSKFSGVNLKNPLWCFCCSKECGLFNSPSASTATWQFHFAGQHGICPWIAWKPPGVQESQVPNIQPYCQRLFQLNCRTKAEVQLPELLPAEKAYSGPSWSFFMMH